jgi:Spy/CpxP family protein refolding chaperone
MRRLLAFLVFFGFLAISAAVMRVNAQDDASGDPADQSGRPPRANGPGGGFQLIPPFAAKELKLTADQKKQIKELEKETKAKLYSILTPKQQKTLETARPPRPGQGGPGGRRGPGGGPGGEGPDGGPDGQPPQPPDEQ